MKIINLIQISAVALLLTACGGGQDADESAAMAEDDSADITVTAGRIGRQSFSRSVGYTVWCAAV